MIDNRNDLFTVLEKVRRHATMPPLLEADFEDAIVWLRDNKDETRTFTEILEDFEAAALEADDAASSIRDAATALRSAIEERKR
jgi:hypothetical protein